MKTPKTLGQSKISKGFTLVELMIAIAIVGVLAAIAIPQFSSYLARARVSEAVNYAQACKAGFVEFYSTRGTFPTSAGDAACTTVVTDNISGVSVNGPRIIVTLVNAAPLPAAIRGHNIILQPLGGVGVVATPGNNILNWRCSFSPNAAGNTGAAAAALELIPTACRQNPL